MSFLQQVRHIPLIFLKDSANVLPNLLEVLSGKMDQGTSIASRAFFSVSCQFYDLSFGVTKRIRDQVDLPDLFVLYCKNLNPNQYYCKI